jgi:hypothetical protein
LAVFWSKDKRAQNQQIQRALQQFESLFASLGRHFT